MIHSIAFGLRIPDLMSQSLDSVKTKSSELFLKVSKEVQNSARDLKNVVFSDSFTNTILISIILMKDENPILNKIGIIIPLVKVYRDIMHRYQFRKCRELKDYNLKIITESFIDPEKNKVAIVFNSVSDKNQAFTLSDNELNIFKDLSKNFSIVVVDIDECAVINRTIDKNHAQGKEISLLMFRCHGNPTAMKCSETENLKNSFLDGYDVRGIHYSKLAPDAKIILSSCSTGTPLSNAPNISEWMQIYAGPNRQVISPGDKITSQDLYYFSVSNEFFFITPSGVITKYVDYASAREKIDEYVERKRKEVESISAQLEMIDHSYLDNN